MPRANCTYPYTFTDKDVKEELQNIYPDLNIDKLCTDIFSILIKRMVSKGSATITNLGRFKGYTIHSTKMNKTVYRTKFIFSYYFIKKIREDEYIINNYNGKEEEQAPFNRETITKRSILPTYMESKYKKIDNIKNSIADILENFDMDDD